MKILRRKTHWAQNGIKQICKLWIKDWLYLHCIALIRAIRIRGHAKWNIKKNWNQRKTIWITKQNSTQIDEIEFWIWIAYATIELEGELYVSESQKIGENWRNNDGAKCEMFSVLSMCMWLMFDFCINRQIHWCHWHYYCDNCIAYHTNNGIKWQFAKFSTPFKLKRLAFKERKEFNEQR